MPLHIARIQITNISRVWVAPSIFLILIFNDLPAYPLTRLNSSMFSTQQSDINVCISFWHSNLLFLYFLAILGEVKIGFHYFFLQCMISRYVSEAIAWRTVAIYRTKMRANKPKLNFKGFQMSHFLLLGMQEYWNSKCGQTWTLTSSMRSVIVSKTFKIVRQKL